MSTRPRTHSAIGGFTRADLAAMPDDGRRHELLDGILVVSPAPRPRHQRTLGHLFRILTDAAPPTLWVLMAPIAVILADDTELQPDLLVAPRAALTDVGLPEAPLLAVEVLSPSTRRYDLHLKRSRYQAAGVTHYWTIDPDEPGLSAWHLIDGAYAQIADVTGDEVFRTDLPFPVAFAVTDLLD